MQFHEIDLPLCRAHPADYKPVVGFCFSFPVEQTDLAAGKLIKLTKRFENEGAVGEDPVKLLQSALERAGMPVSAWSATQGVRRESVCCDAFRDFTIV